MVLPYSVPAIFGTVRRSDETIFPVERYAMYPYMHDGKYPFWRRSAKKPAVRGAKLAGVVASFQLPKGAEEALKSAAFSSAAWLSEGKALIGTLNQFARRDKSVFQQRVIDVDERGALSGQAQAGAERRPYTVAVTSAAMAQRNLGYELTPQAPSVIPWGAHRFLLRMGWDSTLLAVDIRRGDTNAIALGKIRDVVNNAGKGIMASLLEDAVNGVIRFEAVSEQASAAAAFALTDVGSSSCIAASGAGRIVHAASDAVYAIDGGADIVSTSNLIVLQDGLVTLEIAAPLSDPASVTVTVGNDIPAIASQLERILGHVNELHRIYGSASGYLNPMLEQRIHDAMHNASIEAIGIYRDHDEAWTLEEETFQAAMETQPDEVKRLLTGRNGLSGRLESALKRFTSLPTEALISSRARGFQSFTLYRASSKAYLQLPLNGLYVNSFM
ncbi:hypothetical protein [Paenibacillus sp. R14(2021)]|uniref:hypothetical protein n=1 Tax=Paenibacillus sp. R14(2021) TaxID=2859228 RepID=UPI001C612512|nr:hypothetical protein [Paenibacillus sp. R14(2021)]